MGKDKFTVILSQVPTSTGTTGLKPETERLMEETEKLEKKIEELDKKLEGVQIKFIEFLGIFAAIVAFTIASIQVAISKLTFGEIIGVLLALAGVLILFVFAIDSIITKRRR